MKQLSHRHSWLDNPLAKQELIARAGFIQRSAEPGPDRARFVYRMIDAEIERDRKSNPGHWNKIQCRSNCSACCHQSVEVTADEAELLREIALEHDGVLDSVLLDKQRLADNPDDHYMLGFGSNDCVFLDADKQECRIYKDRPLACRSYFVLTPPELCAPQPGESLADAMAAKHVGISVNASVDLWLLAGFLANQREGRKSYPSIAKALA